MLARFHAGTPSKVAIQAFLRRNSTSNHHARLPLKHFTLGVVIGMTGGVTLLAGAGYGLYHYSGLKNAVDTFSPAMFLLRRTREQLATDKVPSHALNYLRQAAKAYVAYIPGAGFLVDRGFNAMDDIADAHADEANAITKKAYQDILEVVKQGGNEHQTTSALKILSITRRLLNELTRLGVKAGKPITDELELENRASQVGQSAEALFHSTKSKIPELQRAIGKLGEKAESLLSGKRAKNKADSSQLLNEQKEKNSASEET